MYAERAGRIWRWKKNICIKLARDKKFKGRVDLTVCNKFYVLIVWVETLEKSCSVSRRKSITRSDYWDIIEVVMTQKVDILRNNLVDFILVCKYPMLMYKYNNRTLISEFSSFKHWHLNFYFHSNRFDLIFNQHFSTSTVVSQYWNRLDLHCHQT